ncbi:MAG: hypothetical protein ACFE95_09925 [Candidatus Hodarchaeota archaeon]
MLIKYKQIQENCQLKRRSICTYWIAETNCQFLYCPFFYNKIPPESREGLNRRLSDEIRFTINDFDLIEKISVQDLIKGIQTDGTTSSSEVQQVNSRFICCSCGKPVFDRGIDKYIELPDPSNPKITLFFHSKDVCNFRKSMIPKIRKWWLKTR